MLLAQLTDTHILAPDFDGEQYVDNNDRLAKAIAALNAENVRPEVVLFTGDLTDTGSAVEMALLAELLAPLEIPLLPLPGNHDLRETFRTAFEMPWATEDSHLGWVAELDDLTIVGVDTIIPGEHGGLIDDERLEWLTESLDDTGDRPTAIAMHHPPFLSGIHWMDEMGLDGRDRFVELVGRYPNLTRIFCGHIHRPLVANVGGAVATVGLSTVHHVHLDLDPAAPVAVIRDPVGYQLHQFDGATWVSHNRYIETGEDPITPAWAESASSFS
ncbi:MAG: phosphodiesterase [Actinomycetota bacterium]